MARVALTNARKVYPGGIEAVKGASLVIEDKEFMVLVGPSGCGKSTMLRLIAGLEDLSAGEIEIGDRVVNDVAPKDRDIAMVFQNYALYPHMTVYKNMAFGLMMRKYKKDEIRRRVMEAAGILGIEDLLDRKPKELSGGQRQRVAVGRAIVRQPAVFLFDEPLSNLDAKLRVQMRAEIGKLHDRLQTTMIYVTHDQVEAMTMGDRITVMLDGAIQQTATPTDLYHRPVNRFVAGFIGSPPMNFARGTLTGENGLLRFREEAGGFEIAVDPAHAGTLRHYTGKQIAFGVRPEQLTDNKDPSPRPGQGIAGQVEVVEPMGAETIVYLRAGSATLAARLHGDTLPRVGDRILLDINPARAYFFDPETGATISIGRGLATG